MSHEQHQFTNTNYRPEEWNNPLKGLTAEIEGIPVLVAANEIYAKILFDSRTGCYNAYYFELFTRNHFDANRDHGQIGIIFVDLNDLKAINDSLGHEAGDVFISNTVKYLKASFRRGDELIRMGGDEFIIICRNADKYDEGEFAKALTAKAKEINKNSPPNISFAHGVAVFDKYKDKDLEGTRERADLEMYNCKKRMKAKPKHRNEKDQQIFKKLKQIFERMRTAIIGR